jgi:hypothetical protein
LGTELKKHVLAENLWKRLTIISPQIRGGDEECKSELMENGTPKVILIAQHVLCRGNATPSYVR